MIFSKTLFKQVASTFFWINEIFLKIISNQFEFSIYLIENKLLVIE